MKQKIILPLVFFSSVLLANTPNSQPASQSVVSETIQAELAKIFPKNDAVVENEACSWKCREVNDGYATQIIGFNFTNGTTFCKVYEKSNLDLDLKFSANQRNKSCVNEVRNGLEIEITQFQNLLNKNKDYSESKITYTDNNNTLTMSNFLSSLVTLNPNIIDREQTKNLGQLVLKNGLDFVSIEKISEYENNTMFEKIINKKDTLEKASANYFNRDEPMPIDEKDYQKTSAADGFNKTNMAYFSNLFMNMEKIYEHLQILLFVIVGGFYISSIGANKLQIYLENRGESASNQPYLHKFYIPLIMVGAFFMPIPEANGTAHSTMIQNVIRYFTTQSTQIADMASAIGSKTYMDKIYKSIGGVNYAGIASLLNQKYEKRYIVFRGEKIYTNTCSKRYTKPYSAQNESYLTALTDEEKEKYKKINNLDFNQIAGGKYDISLEACTSLETEILRARNDLNRIETQLNGIKKFNSDDSIRNRINAIDAYFSIRESQLGWINSLITPSSAILAETFVFADNQTIHYDIKESTEKNKKNTQEFLEKGSIQKGSYDDEIDDSTLGYIAGKLVWMMLPGASSIKDFISDNLNKITAIIGAAIGSYIPIVGSIIGGIIGSVFGSLASTTVGYVTSILLMEWTFEKVPLLVCTTASIIAFVSYLVSLCKYFYISPFVVAFSLATKRMDKIIEFLISGISIFFKPVLIVLFIYLSLFIYTLIDEIFIFMGTEQFSGIQTSSINFYTNFVIGAITGLLVMFGKLASSYIMWKLIISGPSWALSLIGIDGKQDDVIAQGIESNLARRAFVA